MTTSQANVEIVRRWFEPISDGFRMEDHLTLGGALRALGLEGETLAAAGLSE